MFDVVLNGPFELPGAAEDPSAELFFGESCEPTFHEIQPRRTGGGEVEVEAGAFGQPVLDEGCFVGLRSLIVLAILSGLLLRVDDS